MKQEILLLKIHHGIKAEKSHYEAIRGNWKVAARRFDYIQYVVGVDRGEIVCAFQPTAWGTLAEGPEKGRKFFEGVEAPSVAFSRIKNAEEVLIRKFGRGNPVAYAFLSEIE